MTMPPTKPTQTTTTPDWSSLPKTLQPGMFGLVVGPALYWYEGGEELLTRAVEVLSTCRDQDRSAILASLEASTVYDQRRCWDLLDEVETTETTETTETPTTTQPEWRPVTAARLALDAGIHRPSLSRADARRAAKARKKFDC